MAKIQFIRYVEGNTLCYDIKGPPGVIDLKSHMAKIEADSEASDPQKYHTAILRNIVNLCTYPKLDSEQQVLLLDWAHQSVLAEKEIINVTMCENYLLKQQVKELKGRVSEGEEDVGSKCLKTMPAGSDDSASHTDPHNHKMSPSEASDSM